MSLLWEAMYLLKKTPWDTGITPPEIVAMIESRRVTIGRALDLGCGTGTNAIYLARHGFRVTAIDLSRRAVALANRKIRSAHLADRVQVERGDVTLLRKWVDPNSIDFACDIGCFHSLTAAARQRYVLALASVLKADAIYMLYAFESQADRRGVMPDEIVMLFDPAFRLDALQRGSDRGGHGSAWYTLSKREA